MGSLGKVAFEAYVSKLAETRLLAASAFPEWEDLDPDKKEAWEEAGNTVRIHLNRIEDGE